MLGKLLKEEFYTTSRYFFPLYICLAVITIIMKCNIGFLESSNPALSIMSGITIFLYVTAVIALFTATFFIIMIRYYKSMFGDEAYLTFTLPVKPSTILNCKLINGFIWNIISFFLGIISLLILGIGTDLFHEIPYAYANFLTALNDANCSLSSIVWLLASYAVVCLIGIFSGLIIVYFALTLGQFLAPNHKILGAIFSFVIFNIFTTVISNVLEYFFPILQYDELREFADFISFYYKLLIPILVSAVIEFGVLYFITKYLLTNKLNLD